MTLFMQHFSIVVQSRNICYNQCNQKKKGEIVMELKQAIELNGF